MLLVRHLECPLEGFVHASHRFFVSLTFLHGSMVPIRHLKITSPGRTIYIGRCIYCGSAEGDLTLEHATPSGLGGRLYLEDASCPVCQKLIHPAETSIMRGHLIDFREAAGFPRSKKNKPREKIPLKVGKKIVDLEPGEFPRLLYLRVSEQPGVLAGRPLDQAPRHKIILTAPKEDIDPHPPSEVHTKFDHMSFSRMIAKIGWAYGVSEYGLDWLERQEHLIRPLILGQDPNPYHLIGNAGWRVPGIENALHRNEMQVHQLPTGNFLVASIGLFASTGAPPYLAVLARLSPQGLKEALAHRKKELR
jgi:hypothetical protein